jgi:hypothetical protein
MCAREDLIAQGVLHPDEHHGQLYQYGDGGVAHNGNGGSRPPPQPRMRGRLSSSPRSSMRARWSAAALSGCIGVASRNCARR